MIASSVRNASIYPQDYTLFSSFFKVLEIPIIESADELTYDPLLIETNPEQIVRKQATKKVTLSAYLGFEMPKKPPFSNLFVIDPRFVAPPSTFKIKLQGKERCYLGKPGEIYKKDGHALIYGLPHDPITAENAAYVKRFGHRAIIYASFPFEIVEELCSEIIPTNPYATAILISGDVTPKGFKRLEFLLKEIEKQLLYFGNDNISI